MGKNGDSSESVSTSYPSESEGAEVQGPDSGDEAPTKRAKGGAPPLNENAMKDGRYADPKLERERRKAMRERGKTLSPKKEEKRKRRQLYRRRGRDMKRKILSDIPRPSVVEKLAASDIGRLEALCLYWQDEHLEAPTKEARAKAADKLTALVMDKMQSWQRLFAARREAVEATSEPSTRGAIERLVAGIHTGEYVEPPSSPEDAAAEPEPEVEVASEDDADKVVRPREWTAEEYTDEADPRWRNL
jgi:hypothetical protein